MPHDRILIATLGIYTHVVLVIQCVMVIFEVRFLRVEPFIPRRWLQHWPGNCSGGGEWTANISSDDTREVYTRPWLQWNSEALIQILIMQATPRFALFTISDATIKQCNSTYTDSFHVHEIELWQSYVSLQGAPHVAVIHIPHCPLCWYQHLW